ncbi:MAG: hypothetical protein ACPLN0_03285 [Candidatus Hydrothermia bacterium]
MKIPTKTLQKATRQFNKFRFPEVKANVLKNQNGFLKVKFTGAVAPFACCFDENFIDYTYYIKDLSPFDLEIKTIKRKKINVFIVTYKIKLNFIIPNGVK